MVFQEINRLAQVAEWEWAAGKSCGGNLLIPLRPVTRRNIGFQPVFQLRMKLCCELRLFFRQIGGFHRFLRHIIELKAPSWAGIDQPVGFPDVRVYLLGQSARNGMSFLGG